MEGTEVQSREPGRAWHVLETAGGLGGSRQRVD